MGASKNADFVSSAFGGNQKPHVNSVDRSFAQPSKEAKEVKQDPEDAKASKEEIAEKRAKAIEESTITPSDSDKDTFVSKGVHGEKKECDKKKEEAEEEDKKEEDKEEEESKKEDESEK